MKYDLIIKNGMIVDWETKAMIRDIGVKDGKIVQIAEELDPSFAWEFIDAEENLVMPGLIDTHVHAVREDCTDEGFRMLLRAGVTTAMDFKGPLELVLDNFEKTPYKPNLAFLNGIFPGNGFAEQDISYSRLEEFINHSIENGAIGIKILGGHFSVTNETLDRALDICNKMHAYIAIHCGNTLNGSDIKGFLDAVNVAKNRRLHIAHVNSYCRGQIYNELEETKIALEVLRQNRNLISESYLSQINGTSGSIGRDNKPKSHVTRNSLNMKGYDSTREGLESAILNGDCAVYYKTGDEMVLHYGQEAVNYWKGINYEANISFKVNPITSRIACAIDRMDDDFTVTAISTDGGAIPRNSILDKGLLLVELGALTLNELSLKTSLNPAKMLGLHSKGLIKESYDADIIVVDKDTRKPVYTIIEGSIASKDGHLMDSKGKLLILKNAEDNIRKRNIDYQLIDLRESLLYGDGGVRHLT